MSIELEGFELSPQQKRQWKLMKEHGCVFNAVACISIEDKPEERRFDRSLKELVMRHEILRTDFVAIPGLKYPLQVIREEARYHLIWSNEETEGLEITDRELAAQREMNDLYPRITVNKAGRGYDINISVPSLCCDSWSLWQLMYDLLEIYAAFREEDNPDFQDYEPVQYTAYTEWLEELEEESASARAWWREQIEETDDPLETYLREEQSGFAIDWVFHEAHSLTKDTGSASFWLASWLLLLSRFTGRDNTSIAVSFDGRSFEELETSCGLFQRSLPLTIRHQPDVSFNQMRAGIQHRMAQMDKRQDFFRSDEYEQAPLVGFEFFTPPEDPMETDGYYSMTAAFSTTEPFGLKLRVSIEEETVRPLIFFDRGRFDQEFAEKLASDLHTLVTAAVKDSNRSIAALPSVNEVDELEIMTALTGSNLEVAETRSVNILFQEQARNHPDKPAIVFQPGNRDLSEEVLTYSQLQQSANRLAHYMASKGATPEKPVAICLDRSTELLVTMLASLLSGAGYVPIDPNLPPQRIAEMVHSSGACLLVTNGEQEVGDIAVPRFCPQQEQDAISGCSHHVLPVSVHLENLAYGIFTSGSTGKPKMVGVSHGNLLHYLESICDALELTSGDSYAVVSTLAADLGNTCIYPALCCGGTLHLLSGQHISDAAAFAAYFQRHQIDNLKITPSHLNVLMTGGSGVLPHKRLILGGEATPMELVRAIEKAAPQLQIYNHYGPSETTIGTITHAHEFGSDDFPLGEPIANSRVYLLTSGLVPTPNLAPGELFLSGPGVTRGYPGKPTLTAERFIPDPYSETPGMRMYRSGDIAWLDHQVLVFHGRADHQVKLRGFRIELGEIEYCLRQHQQVREAVVILRRDTTGDRLVAYITTAPDKPSPHDLRTHLAEQLPDYMIPAAFVLLDRMPLNPNGKLDRKALPEPTANAADHAVYQAPRGEAEETLVDLWQEFLKVDRIGALDNFFELGGHSFLAIRTVAALKERFGVALPVRVLLENPRLSDFARVIEQHQEETSALSPDEWLAERAGRLRIATLEHLGQSFIFWYTNQNLFDVSRNCPDQLLPYFVLSEDDQRDLQTFVQSLPAANPYLGVPSARQRLQDFYDEGPKRESYDCGHHPGWFIRREVHTVNLVDMVVQRPLDEARVLRQVNRFLAAQDLMRSALVHKGEDLYHFVEAEMLHLDHLDLTDLSGAQPESRKAVLEAVKTNLWKDLMDEKRLGRLLFNVALVKEHESCYHLIFGMDHIIADYEVKTVVNRFFKCLESWEDLDADHTHKLPVAPYARFAEMIETLPNDSPMISQIKEDPVYQAYRHEVAKMHEIYELGKPIVFSDGFLLEAWLEDSMEESNYLGHGIAAAVRILSSLFQLDRVPLRILFSRRYAGGVNFYNTMGDFHDSMPVLYPKDMTEGDLCFGKLQETTQHFVDRGIELTRVGREPDIYHHVYKCQFSFNFVGELPPNQEYNAIMTSQVIKFLIYPMYAYHVGNRLGIIINHGLSGDMEQQLRDFLAHHYKRWRLRKLTEPVKQQLITAIRETGAMPDED